MNSPWKRHVATDLSDARFHLLALFKGSVARLTISSSASVFGVSAAVALLVCVVLVGGWVNEQTTLLFIVAGWPTMKPLTAIMLFFTSLSLLSSLRPETRTIGVIVGLSATAIALWIILGLPLAPDNWLFLKPARSTAVTGLMLASAVTLLSYRARPPWLITMLAMLALLLPMQQLIALPMSGPGPVGGSWFDTMAIHTAIALASLAAFGVLLHPRLPYAHKLAEPSLVGNSLRVGIGATIVAPLVVGVMSRIALDRWHWPAANVAAMVVLSLAMMMTAMWWVGLHRLEHAQLQSARSAEHFERLFQNAPIGELLIDKAGRIRDSNSAIEAIFGYSRQSLRDRSIRDLLPSNSAETTAWLETVLHNHKNSPAASGANIRGRRSDGSEIPLEVALTSLDFDETPVTLVMLLDISERLINWNLQSRLAAIINSSDDAIVSKTLDSVVTSWNAGAEKLFGYAADEMIGQPITRIFPDDRVGEEQLLIGKIAQGEHVAHYETVRLRKGGARLDVSVTLSPLYDAEGQVIGVSKIARDISRNKQLEAELRRNLEELKRSNDALEQFAWAASHDLQEPLRMVASYTQLIAKDYTELIDKEGREMMGYVVDGAQRMQLLVKDLMAFSRAQLSLEKGVFADAGVACCRAIDLLAAVIKAASATVTMDQAMPMVRLDPIALTQIWQNLISNALKYRRNEAPQVHAGVSDITQSDVTFVVADNGIGINPKNHERVFRFFQRLNAEHQGMTRGSGIGLALCDRIVRAAGGHIWVESDGETGSRFYFTLPIHGPEEIP